MPPAKRHPCDLVKLQSLVVYNLVKGHFTGGLQITKAKTSTDRADLVQLCNLEINMKIRMTLNGLFQDINQMYAILNKLCP